jgi:phytoene desaturase
MVANLQPDLAVAAPSTHRRPKALVLGSGFGGLAAAVRLLARGFEVEVLEALAEPGGRARVFVEHDEHGAYRFDAGPTVITAPFMFEELFELLGERLSDHVQMVPVTPFYNIRFDDGSWFRYTGDGAQMEAEVARIAPDDVAGYKAFVRQSEAIFKVGFTRLAHKPFTHLSDMLRIVPDMMRLQSYRTVYGLASRYVRHEKLRQVLSFHPLLVGGNPFDTTSIYTLILFLERHWGVHFPMGGTGALVDGLVGLIRRHGGQVHMNHAARSIDVEGGKVTGVTLQDSSHRACDLVVSNVDSATTYNKLIDAKHRKTWTDKRLANKRYSMGLFVWYFGTDRRYPDVAHHSIVLGPRYKELLQDIFDHHVLADDFSMYLHRPTATDPSLAPPGCDGFYVLSPVPHLQAGVDWTARAEPYRQRLADELERSGVLPDLSRHLTVSRVLTPQHFQDELNSFRGAAFGLAPVLRQSAYFRPHNKSEDIEGLYLVGAGTHPGAGLPGVLSSARALDTFDLGVGLQKAPAP